MLPLMFYFGQFKCTLSLAFITKTTPTVPCIFGFVAVQDSVNATSVLGCVSSSAKYIVAKSVCKSTPTLTKLTRTYGFDVRQAVRAADVVK